MNSRTRTLLNTLFSSVGIYTEYLLGMVTSVIIARHLGPESFGTYSLVIWFVAMGVAFTNSGTSSTAIKFIAELRGEGREELVPTLVAYLRRAQQMFLLGVAAVGAALFLFAGERVIPGINHLMLLGFLVIAVMLRATYMFNVGVAKGFENFRATALIALIATPTNLLLVIVAIWFDAPLEWLLAVFTISGVVFYAVSWQQVRKMLPAKAERVPLPPILMDRVRRYMLLTAMTVTFGFCVASEVEVLFLNLYADAEASGHFKVAYQLAVGAASLVPGVFGALLLPMMASALTQSREMAGQRFVASTTYLVLLAAPLIAFGFDFSNEVIHLLYGPAYAAAGPVFAVCLAAASITSATQGGSSLIISADRQGTILLMVIICGVLKVALGLFLVKQMGLYGAVLAYLLVSLIGDAIIIAMAMRVGRTRPDWPRLGRVVLAAAVAALVAYPMRWQPMPWLAVIGGGALLVGVYLPLTVLLGCWSHRDLNHLQELHGRLLSGRPLMAARFLEWGRTRALQKEAA